MKKIISIAMIFFAIIFLVACETGPTLKLYNWGLYIDDDIVKDFEDETGIRVKQISFDSNEIAITQIKSGNQYDLVIPSDYAIEQLANENLIDPIDWSRLTTFSKETDLADSLSHVLNKLNEGPDGFDMLKYAVPYFWGNVGILYNTNTVDTDDLETLGWDALTLSTKYKVAFYNSSREAYLIALKQLEASSVNHPTEVEFAAATQWLNQALTKDTYVITDDIFSAMIERPARYDLAVSYSGDANYLMQENDDLSFFVPDQGTNVWVDAFVTPKGADLDLAYQFMNFMLTYDSAKRNTEFVGYSTPRKDVFLDVLGEGETFNGYEASYDVRINENDEVYRHNDTLKLRMDSSWQEILASKGFDDGGLGTGTIIAIIAVGVLLVSSITVTAIRKRKR
ncbi:MAG: ABC transporter substrate-binding protein [Acholeplasmataceae bacterium]|nr:ABC transporter substrate-binding protein [Acholeplasmataceae bacterium]